MRDEDIDVFILENLVGGNIDVHSLSLAAVSWQLGDCPRILLNVEEVGLISMQVAS